MDRKENEVLTVADVAEYLRVHPSTIYKLLKARKLPAFRVGTCLWGIPTQAAAGV